MDTMELKEVLSSLLKRTEDLERQVQELQRPELMYRRPGKEEHENITSFFDDVEIRLQKLESNEISSNLSGS